MQFEIEGVFWGEFFWGEKFWESSDQTARRRFSFFDQFIIGRMLSAKIDYTSTTDQMKILKIEHRMNIVKQAFQLRP